MDKKMTLGRGYGDHLTMYDFRHSSACFWLPKYKSRSALLYRFGWKKEEEIHYYTELLGMKDTISEEDMLTGMDKTEIEKEISKLKRENTLKKEAFTRLDDENKKIWKLLNKLVVMSKITYEAATQNKDVKKGLKKAAQKIMSKGSAVYTFEEST